MHIRKITAACICATMLALGGCGNANWHAAGLNDTNRSHDSDTSKKHTPNRKGNNMAAVVYFSRAGENYGVGSVKVGNTAKLAEAIAQATDSPTIEITRDEPYPESYDETTNEAQSEQRNNTRPHITLKGDVDALDDATIVYLGYPMWWGDAPMPVYSFLESREWSGKTIYPFCTHEGSGLGSTPDNIAKAASGATIENGLAVRGTDAQQNDDKTRRAVNQWLSKQK